MQIVIDIDEELYNYIQTVEYVDKYLEKRSDYQIRYAIKNGTPLSKNCRLIDANALPNEVQGLYSIRTAPTIIETEGSDKE